MVVNKFGTLKNLNKPLYFNGLSPLQMLLIFLALIIGFIVFQFYTIVLLIPISMYGKWVSKKTNLGCPNIIGSIQVWSSTRKKFIDQGIFKNLIINGSSRIIK